MNCLHRDVAIRPMSHKDLIDVMTIENDSHERPWSTESFLSEMRNPVGHAFVAHDGRCVLGYVIFWMIADETHLLNLTIRPDFRGRGLGKRLMAFLIDFARRQGAQWIGLEVRRSNEAALALYRRFGFQEARVRAAYYPDTQEDGIIMELGLDHDCS